MTNKYKEYIRTILPWTIEMVSYEKARELKCEAAFMKFSNSAYPFDFHEMFEGEWGIMYDKRYLVTSYK